MINTGVQLGNYSFNKKGYKKLLIQLPIEKKTTKLKMLKLNVMTHMNYKEFASMVLCKRIQCLDWGGENDTHTPMMLTK